MTGAVSNGHSGFENANKTVFDICVALRHGSTVRVGDLLLPQEEAPTEKPDCALIGLAAITN
jgi:hypothetical protein